MKPPKLKVSEDDFQKTIIQLAQMCGWKVAHFRKARTNKGWRTPVAADGAGFPDCVMVNRKTGVVLFVEFKAETGRLSGDQKEWANVLHDIMCHQKQRVYQRVWKPSDTDEIEKFLTEK